MHTIDEIIIGLECFKSRIHKCETCPFNPVPGFVWTYGCITGQNDVAEEAIRIIRKAEKTSEIR